jgi:(p)ppGpp synthase/HD superfamily hydrolase
MTPSKLFSDRLEQASRFAAICHRNQLRKASEAPYVQHPVSVALILDRLGFGEDVVIAGLLHDVVEDTPASLDEIEHRFGTQVKTLVACCTERKLDSAGIKRPWSERKNEQLARLRDASMEARAVALADKLHNLISVRHDLEAGEEVWSRFSADRETWLGSYRTAVEQLSQPNDDHSMLRLAEECRQLLAELAALVADPGSHAPWG